MTKSWTTKSGKKVEIEIEVLKGASLVRLSMLVIDGKKYSNPKYIGANVEFTDGYKGQKLAISVPSEITAEIEAMKSESGKMTAAQIAVKKCPC